jgi:hypothetical protein
MSIERHFLGGCAVAKLTAQLDGTDSGKVLNMSTMAGWDFLHGAVFEVSVDRGLASEEKMLCTVGSRNPDGSGTLTVYTDPTSGTVYRGYDDTPVTVHPVDAKVEHVWTATDAREALDAAHALQSAPAHRHQTWGDLFTPPPVQPVQPIP